MTDVFKCFTDMLRNEHARRRAYVNCSGVLKELANLSLRFRSVKGKTSLRCMYLNIKNNKYSTNKGLRSLKEKIKERVINFQDKMQQAMYV